MDKFFKEAKIAWDDDEDLRRNFGYDFTAWLAAFQAGDGINLSGAKTMSNNKAGRLTTEGLREEAQKEFNQDADIRREYGNFETFFGYVLSRVKGGKLQEPGRCSCPANVGGN